MQITKSSVTALNEKKKQSPSGKQKTTVTSLCQENRALSDASFIVYISPSAERSTREDSKRRNADARGEPPAKTNRRQKVENGLGHRSWEEIELAAVIFPRDIGQNVSNNCE